MAKKILGIYGYQNELAFGVGKAYLEFISTFGHPKILMPWQTVQTAQVDALFIPGGADIRPDMYNEIPGYKTSSTDVHKQHFYDHLMEGYIQANIPLIGICAGFQVLAVRFGYKLVQNLPFHPQSKDRWTAGHKITYVGQENVPEKEKLSVNSHHHQGVIYDPNNQELEMLSYYDDYSGRVVESFRHRTRPIVLIQNHPEEFYGQHEVELIDRLINPQNYLNETTTR